MNYFLKYIKYKNKYIKLLNIIEGGDGKLITAIRNKMDNKDIIDMINKGLVDINEKYDRYKSTALMFAVNANNIEIVKLLLTKKGILIDLQETHQQKTALMYAIQNNNIEIVTLLLKAGATLEHKDHNGYTELAIAVYYRTTDIQIIKLLLSYGANIDAVTKYNKTILELAQIKERNDDVIKLLIKHDVLKEDQKEDIVIDKNIKKEILLINAIKNRNEKVAQQLLLDKNIDITFVDESRKTIVRYAIEYKLDNIVKLIEDIVCQKECPICFEKFANIDNIYIINPCSHTICIKCFEILLDKDKCPICVQSIHPIIPINRYDPKKKMIFSKKYIKYKN